MDVISNAKSDFSIQVILNYSEEQEELRTFSGPLIR